MNFSSKANAFEIDLDEFDPEDVNIDVTQKVTFNCKQVWRIDEGLVAQNGSSLVKVPEARLSGEATCRLKVDGDEAAQASVDVEQARGNARFSVPGGENFVVTGQNIFCGFESDGPLSTRTLIERAQAARKAKTGR